MSTSTSNVTFRVTAPLSSGQVIHVLGDCPALGAWSSSASVPLVTSTDCFPLWFTPKPLHLPLHTPVHYKYCVVAEGRMMRWEAIEGQRVITPRGREMMVEDALDVTPAGSSIQVPPPDDTSSPTTTSTAVAAPPQRLHSTSSAVGGGIVTSASSPAISTLARRGTTSAVAPPREVLLESTSSPVASSVGTSDTGESSGSGAGGSSAIHASDAPRPDTLTDADGVLIVQFQLPVILNRSVAASDGEVTWTAAWDEEALLAPKGGAHAHSAARVKWIGTPPVRVPPGEEEAVQRALEPLRCIPVYIPPATLDSYYDGYCRDTLWPVFHNVIDVYGSLPTRWWNRERQNDRWKSYMDANQKFASTVVENYHDGDLVWIQDYPLLLVPMMLARRHIATVGLFLHIPFPSSEVFRSLSFRDELLRGMLNAEHIGFHLFEYARHFLTSCRRILGLTHSSRRGGCLTVDYQGREVTVTVSHVGIEPDFLQAQFARTPSLVDAAAAWKERFAGAAIVAGIEGIERLKGVPLKLLAWETFLSTHPAYVGKVVLVQLCLHDTVRPGDTQEVTIDEIKSLVGRINAAYGRPGVPAVHVEMRDTVPHVHERLALWAASDVLLNTSIRDGLNLYPFEFAYVRGGGTCIPAALDALSTSASARATALANAAPGVLIISEFSGASRVLSGSLRVNPWRLEEVVSALEHALSMSVEEQGARASSNLTYICGNSTSMWARRVLTDLKAASKRTGSRTFMGFGLGLGYRLTGFGSSFKPLNMETVVAAWRKAKHRLIVCDYGGTLNVRDSSLTRKRAFELGLLGKDAAPPLTHEIKRALRILTEDAANTVFIISGKDREVMQQAFAALPHVGLAAEHGFYVRWGAPVRRRAPRGSVPSRSPTASGTSADGTGITEPIVPATPALFGASGAPPLAPVMEGVSSNGMPWETLGATDRFDDWKMLAFGIMEMYAARTNGVYILRKGSAVSWHYADADPEFGFMQAKEMQDHLQGILAGYAVDVLSGQGYVEVRPKGVGKGVVLSHIMDLLEGRESSGQTFNLSRAGAHEQSFASAGSHEDGASDTASAATGAGRGSPALRGTARGLASSSNVRPRLSSPLMRSTAAPEDPPAQLSTSAAEPGATRGFASTGSLSSLGTPAGSESPSGRKRRVPPGRGSDWSPRPLEFILVIGDDLADEEMFTVVQTYRKERFAEARAVIAHMSATTAASLGMYPSTGSPAVAAEYAAHAVAEDASARAAVDAAEATATGDDRGGLPSSMAPAPRVSKFGVNILGNVDDASTRAGGSSGGATSPDASTPPRTPAFQYHEFTVTVGKKPSSAQYYLDDTQAVEDVLKTLARASQRPKVTTTPAARAPPLHPFNPALLPSSSTNRGSGGALAQVAVAQAFQQRLRGIGPGGGGIAMMSMPANMDRLAVSTSSGGGHMFLFPTPSGASPSTLGSSISAEGTSPFPRGIQGGRSTVTVTGRASLGGTARTADVSVGVPNALAGLIAGSSSRLHALPHTLARVPEARGDEPRRTSSGDVARDDGGLDHGDDDVGEEEEEEDDLYDEEEEQQEEENGRETAVDSMSPRAGGSAGGLAGGVVMRVPSTEAVFAAGVGVALQVVSAGDLLGAPIPAGPVSAGASLLAAVRSSGSVGSLAALAAAGASSPPVAVLSAGLTQYFDRIQEGNEEEVPEF